MSSLHCTIQLAGARVMKGHCLYLDVHDTTEASLSPPPLIIRSARGGGAGSAQSAMTQGVKSLNAL